MVISMKCARSFSHSSDEDNFDLTTCETTRESKDIETEYSSNFQNKDVKNILELNEILEELILSKGQGFEEYLQKLENFKNFDEETHKLYNNILRYKNMTDAFPKKIKK